MQQGSPVIKRSILQSKEVLLIDMERMASSRRGRNEHVVSPQSNSKIGYMMSLVIFHHC